MQDPTMNPPSAADDNSADVGESTVISDLQTTDPSKAADNKSKDLGESTMISSDLQTKNEVVADEIHVPIAIDFVPSSDQHDGDVDATPENVFDELRKLHELAETYQDGLEEKQIAYVARYRSIRLSAYISILFMIVFSTIGVWIFMTQAGATLAEAMLLLMYTLTSAGFGSVTIPKTDSFLAFLIVYLFIAISALAILVAQVFQYLSWESSRAQHARDKARGARLGLENLMSLQDDEETVSQTTLLLRQELKRSLRQLNPGRLYGWSNHFQGVGTFFRQTECGQALISFGIMSTLLLIGAFGMMYLEGWTFIQALYFSTFSMSTVGYGNFIPTTTTSTWFVVVWLPFNVLFLATFLQSVAHYWVLLCDMNTRRVERNLRQQRNLQAKQDSHQDSEKANMHDTDQIENHTALLEQAASEVAAKSKEDPSTTSDRPRRTREVSNLSFEEPSSTGDIATTMHGLIKAVHTQIDRGEVFATNEMCNSLLFGNQVDQDASGTLDPDRLAEHEPAQKSVSLALRVLVEERVAHIIAFEIAGTDFIAELKDDETLLVTIEKLKSVANKWKIPSVARKAFRQVVFETLFFVGERALLKRGVESFFEMSPLAFNTLLTPFVLSMDDVETIESWLASTDVQAAEHLQLQENRISEGAMRCGPRCVVKDEIDDFFPPNQGNAVLITQR